MNTTHHTMTTTNTTTLCDGSCGGHQENLGNGCLAHNNVEPGDAAIEADIDALNAHQAAIDPLHRAAFRGPVVNPYAVGDIVWLWDDYSTATVVGQSSNGNTLVRSVDCDGNDATYSYLPELLRPALSAAVFLWPSKR